MATGVLKFYSPHQGHGVVQADDGTELYVSSATLANAGLQHIREGARIEFGVDSRGGGAGITVAAVNIMLLAEEKN